MSAKEQIRAMLDQLMGSRADETSRRSITFDDPRVCRPFLLGCCPHEILAGTRVDLGECPKIHDFALRSDYETASKTKDYYYDVDALDILEQFVIDCDRRTEFSKRKLKETQEELGEEAARKVNVIHQLGEQIGTKLATAEELGAEGRVDESMKLMDEVEQLKKQKAECEYDFRNSMPASTYQQQKLRVCEVCSAYLGIHDNDRRLADHFGGKLHLGFIQIREKLADLRQRVEDRRAKRSLDRYSPRGIGNDIGDYSSRLPPAAIIETRRSRSHRERSVSKNSSRKLSRSRSRSRHRRRHRSRSHSHRHHRRHRRSSSSRKSHKKSRRYHRSSSSDSHIRHASNSPGRRGYIRVNGSDESAMNAEFAQND